VEQVLAKIGVEQKSGESGAIVIFRTKLLSWACRFGMSSCFNYASKLFEQWKADNQTDPYDSKNIVLWAN